MKHIRQCFKLDVARTMPVLRHTVNDTFDLNTSEVIAWLVNQPVIRNYVFQKIKDRGLIVFDPVTRTWRGKDYKPDTGAERYRF
jgi:hypothetical protein